MRKLDQGYTTEVDKIDRICWESSLLEFEDSSYYQTWAFGDIHSGKQSLSHLILKREGQLVGMAQVRIIRAGSLPLGVALVNSGPIFVSKEAGFKRENHHNLLRALYIEYVERRGYFLRILPNKLDNEYEAGVIGKHIYEEEGYSRGISHEKTVIIDLSNSIDEIKRQMSRNWRRNLKKGESHNLVIMESNDIDLEQIALRFYLEMKKRKRFVGGNQFEALRVNRQLNEPMKLKLVVCLYNNEPIAILGWTKIGKVGLPLIAATGQRALDKCASYVLWWKMIEYYKENGYIAVDMGGVNEKRNPGGYYFKTQILGENLRRQPQLVGPYDACENYLSWVLFVMLQNSRRLLKAIQASL